MVSCGALAAIDYMPGNPSSVIAANYDANYGLGRFYGDDKGAAFRGGAWYFDTYGGIFTLGLYAPPTYAATDIGFRCVFRP